MSFVDTAGTSFLILVIGGGEAGAEVAREWVAAAEPLGPTTLGVLDDIDDPADRAVLDDLVERARTGVRVMVTGRRYDVQQTLALLRAAGALEGELTAIVLDATDLAVFCGHCQRIFRAEVAPGDIVACHGCDRLLEVHDHAARHLGAYLASYVAAPAEVAT